MQHYVLRCYIKNFTTVVEIKTEDKISLIKMLRFMDDYWNVSVQDRTITPEFMQQLKTTPYKVFPIE